MSTASQQVASKHYALTGLYSRISEKNVWVEFSGLTRDYNACNLGQGMPNYESYLPLNEIVRQVLDEADPMIHQYTRSLGHPRLVKAVAQLYEKFLGREIDPLNEVMITIGAYGSLFNSFCSFIERDDEVIIIEPFFDCYGPFAVVCGGNCKYVPLRPPKESENGQSSTYGSSNDWRWDDEELERAFTPKTRFIIMNTPNNPLGKVYTRSELERIAELCIKYNVLCISDEVYQHLTYGREHVRIATLPGMWERTVTIGSAGKLFSSTGLQMGWTVGPRELIRKSAIVHNNSIYCCPTYMQEVVARCIELEMSRLDKPECYFNTVNLELQPKRDRLLSIFAKAGLRPVVPDGGYFIMVDISRLADKIDLRNDTSDDAKDVKFVRHLIKEKGLAAIPTTAFYAPEHEHLGENFIRFCFFKDDSTIQRAQEILEKI